MNKTYAAFKINHPENLHTRAHREAALDSAGGPSINASTSVAETSTRPLYFSFETHLPFIRDPKVEHSGWGVGIGAYISHSKTNSEVISDSTQTFEVSVGRIRILESLEQSTGLQGFFEGGYQHNKIENKSDPERSIFLRVGAKSHREGRGIVSYKPYKVDQSLITSLSLPIELGDTYFGVSHKTFVSCFSKYLDCGTKLKYNYTTNTEIESLDAVPSLWIEYGLHLNLFLESRKYMLSLDLSWDVIKTNMDPRWSFYKAPVVNSKFSMVF